MDERGSMKHARTLRIATAITAILAALVVLASFGIKLPPVPYRPIALDGPMIADTNDRITAIADAESRRVLILNYEHRLTGIINCESLNSPIEAVTDVCVSGGEVFVAGVKYEKDSDIIVRERVVAYDMRGGSREIVYDTGDVSVQSPTIKSLCEARKGVLVATLLEEEITGNDGEDLMQVIYANRSGRESRVEEYVGWMSVFGLGYNEVCGTYATLSIRGLINDTFDQGTDSGRDGYVFTSIDIADDGSIYARDDNSGAIYRIVDGGEPQKVRDGEGLGKIHVNGQMLTACNPKANRVEISDLKDADSLCFEEVYPTASLDTYVLVVWICRAYLGVYVLVFLTRKARKLIREENTSGIGPMFASLAVVMAMSLAIGYNTYGSYKALRQTRANEINAYADYFKSIAPSLSEGIDADLDRNAIRAQDDKLARVVSQIVFLEDRVGGLVFSSTENGIGAYAAVYGKDGQGAFYLSDSSNEHIIGTGVSTGSNRTDIEEIFNTNKDDPEMHSGRTLYDDSQYRLVRVPSSDGKDTVAVIEVGSRVRTFESSIMGQELQRTIALLVLVLVVYLTYAEIRACAECFLMYRHIQQTQARDALALLTRPFSFCVTLLSSVDGVMTTLIARSMLESHAGDDKGLLLALPTVMMGVGLALGQVVYGLLGSRVPLRKLIVRGALCVVAFALFTASVVWRENFGLYCFAKLLMAIPFGLLYTLSYSLPRRAKTDEVRELAAGGIKRTDTSAAALGTVLGGYAAQMLGNAWVYIIVAVTSIPAFLMAASLFPRGKKPLESKVEDEARVPYRVVVLRLFRERMTVCIILFAMLPVFLAAGYKSFLFPLFSADAGLDTSSINNMFVLGQLIVYVLIATLEQIELKYDKWRVTVVSVTLLGCVFLLFSLNATLVWAIVSIVLVGMLCKAADGWKALWIRSADACGVSAGVTVGAMFATRSVILVVQPLLLGWLLGSGNQVVTVVLGLLCAACGVMFYFTTRRTALAPKDLDL